MAARCVEFISYCPSAFPANSTSSSASNVMGLLLFWTVVCIRMELCLFVSCRMICELDSLLTLRFMGPGALRCYGSGFTSMLLSLGVGNYWLLRLLLLTLFIYNGRIIPVFYRLYMVMRLTFFFARLTREETRRSSLRVTLEFAWVGANVAAAVSPPMVLLVIFNWHWSLFNLFGILKKLRAPVPFNPCFILLLLFSSSIFFPNRCDAVTLFCCEVIVFESPSVEIETGLIPELIFIWRVNSDSLPSTYEEIMNGCLYFLGE